jgi:hypothetical protein
VTLDLLGGFRYVGIKASLDWNFSTPIPFLPGGSGSVSQNVDLWDGIIGARGRLNFGETKWYAPYYIDVGTGSSQFTWQGLVGIGYAFRWGDVLLAYRSLSIEQGDNKLIQHIRFSGPALGATFHF